MGWSNLKSALHVFGSSSSLAPLVVVDGGLVWEWWTGVGVGW